MYHEDRLGGGGFSRVVLSGASRRGAPTPASGCGAASRSGSASRVEPLDFRGAVALRDRIAAGTGAARQRWRPPSASSSGSRSPDAADQPLDPAVLQRARRPRRCSRWRGARRAGADRAATSSASSRCRATTPSCRRRIERRPRRSRAPDGGGGRASGDGINQDELAASWSRAAQEANALIDQRTFSWTELFNQIEATLPPDVMLTSVRPAVQGRRDARRRWSCWAGAPTTSTSSWRSSRRRARFDDVLPAQRGSHRGRAAPRRDREHVHRQSSRTSAAAEAAPAQRRRQGHAVSGHAGARSRRKREAPVTPARRVLREKRALIWPIAIALIAERRSVRRRRLSAVEEGRRRRAGRRGICRALAAAHGATSTRRTATVPGKEQADAELQKFYGDVLPPDMSGARRITFLRLAQLAHAVRPAPRARDIEREAASRTATSSKFTYTAALSGEYRDIRRFIHALETAPEFLVLENVELTQSERRDEGAERQRRRSRRTSGRGPMDD